MPANAQPIRAPCGLHPAPPLLGAGGQRGAVRAALAAGVRAPRAATLQRLHTHSYSARAVPLGRHDSRCPPHVTGAAPSDWRSRPAPRRRGKRVAAPRARVNGRGPACEGPANGREALVRPRAGRGALVRARAPRSKRGLEAPSLLRYSLSTSI